MDIQWRIHVRDLHRGRSNGQTASFDLQSVFDLNIEVLYARLMESGDIVIGTRLYASDELATLDSRIAALISTKYELTRLSQSGSTIWSVEIGRTTRVVYEAWGIPTTFNNRHYGFELVKDTDLVVTSGIAFTIRNLEDGQIMMQRELPMAIVQEMVNRGLIGQPPQLDVATDGTFLVLEAFDYDRTLIINAADGDCFFFGKATPKTGLPAGDATSMWIIKYWQYESVSSRHLMFNSATKELRFAEIRIILQRSHRSRPGIDMDRTLVYRLIHSDACPIHEPDTVDPWTTFAVVEMEEDTEYRDPPRKPIHAFLEQKKTKVVTLPLQRNPTANDSRSKKKRKSKEPKPDRRLLEFEAAWSLLPADFIGMSNDYLVHHSTKNEALLVLDFWPQW